MLFNYYDSDSDDREPDYDEEFKIVILGDDSIFFAEVVHGVRVYLLVCTNRKGLIVWENNITCYILIIGKANTFQYISTIFMKG